MHPNKHITSFLTHSFISQTKKSLCRVDCCINLSQHDLSPPGSKIGIPGGRVGMRSVGISESRSCGGCGAIPAVCHQQQRGKVPEGLGHHNGSTTSTKTEQWHHTPQRNERPTDGGKAGRWFVALMRSGGQSEDAASFNYIQT